MTEDRKILEQSYYDRKEYKISDINFSVDFNNIYVLDQGNSRIVVLDKTGSYKAQYQADILRNATDFEILETDKKVYVLSNGKVYEIDLK